MNSNALDGLNWNLSAIAYGLRALLTPSYHLFNILVLVEERCLQSLLYHTMHECAPPSPLTPHSYPYVKIAPSDSALPQLTIHLYPHPLKTNESTPSS